MKKFTKVFVWVLFGIAFANIALAQSGLPVSDLTNAPTGPRTTGELVQVIQRIINLLFTALIIIAVVFIFIAAFIYVGAGGDATKVKKAKDYIVYALIAVVVGILAQGLVAVIKAFFGDRGLG